MVIAFIALGILFGGLGAVLTMVSGGTFLFALLVYSGVGTISVLGGILGMMLIGDKSLPKSDWDNQHSVSA
ncbi:MAG: hypothetical protein KUG58_07550 [Marinosulfonomonas sp.]|nr:hypothetical protein [Marinosulfonomonas sp.]